jgi:hypothetical protein
VKTKLLTLAIVLACATLQAHAVGHLADVSLLDRDSGATLPVYYHRGEYWVAGKPGARYAVSVRNRIGERLLAVPAVDGVNVLSGETAGWNQSGYVFAPLEKYQITGWRKSNSEVAAFEFSAAADSYAGLTGRPGSVGVIGVALFRERPPEPVAMAPQTAPALQAPGMDVPKRLRDALSGRAESDSISEGRAAAAAPPAASGSGELSAQAERAPSLRDNSLAKTAPTSAPKLGTAHGQRETSVVSHTRFERLQPQPNEVIRIRYDSRENLVASGVIREPVAYPMPAPNPFPQSANTSYVPDPPVRRY